MPFISSSELCSRIKALSRKTWYLNNPFQKKKKKLNQWLSHKESSGVETPAQGRWSPQLAGNPPVQMQEDVRGKMCRWEGTHHLRLKSLLWTTMYISTINYYVYQYY